MIELICVKDSFSSYGSIKKGEFVFTTQIYDDGFISLYAENSLIAKFRGFHSEEYFLTLDKWREQKINNILNT